MPFGLTTPGKSKGSFARGKVFPKKSGSSPEAAKPSAQEVEEKKKKREKDEVSALKERLAKGHRLNDQEVRAQTAARRVGGREDVARAARKDRRTLRACHTPARVRAPRDRARDPRSYFHALSTERARARAHPRKTPTRVRGRASTC